MRLETILIASNGRPVSWRSLRCRSACAARDEGTGTGATVLHSYACIGALNLYELAMSVPSLQVCFAPDCRDQFGPRSSYAATLCSWDAQDRLVGELAAKKNLLAASASDPVRGKGRRGI